MAQTTMHALQFTSTTNGIEKHMSINKSTAVPPKLKSGETLVRVSCAALNPVDFKFPELPLVGGMVAKPPASPGLDFSGHVAETLNPDLKEGQRVLCRLSSPARFGAVAELAVAPKEGCVPLPDGVSFEQGAAVGTAALTAYQCIAPNVSGKTGQRVFINGGSGGVGTWGIQIAKALGCVVTTSCSTANVALCKELGADEVLDYKSCDLSQTLKSKVQEGAYEAFDLCVDNVGVPTDLYKSADVFLKPSGKFVQVGANISLSAIGSISSRMMRPALLGGGKRPFVFLDVQNKADDFRAMASMMEEGKVKAVIDEVFPYEKTGDAYAKLRTGRAKGKIIVRVSEE